jgi:RNA polymerase sigma factor (sigma-70 family)
MAKADNEQVRWLQEALAQYERPLVRYALRMTGDLELARDIVQDTFLQACRAGQARLDGHLQPWLYRVCRNRALDVLKKEQRMQHLDVQTMEARPSKERPPGEQAAGRETEALVLAELAKLPANQQEVFRLKFQDQLSYKEISAVTGFPVHNVRYLIHTSLKTMREQLRGHFNLVRES